jgi:beta-lactamase class A
MALLSRQLDPIETMLRENVPDYDFYFCDFESGEKIRFGHQRRFPLASCFKLAVLSSVLAHGGAPFLETTLEVNCDKVVEYATGPLNHFKGSVRLTVDNLLRLMIDFSDGIATDTLIDAIGFARIKAVIKTSTQNSEANSNIRNLINNLVVRAKELSDTAQPCRENYLAALEDTAILTDYTDAKDLASLVAATYSDSRLKTYLRGERSNPRSSAYLPSDVKILGKTGTLGFFASVNDCGIIESQGQPKASFGITTLGWKKPSYEIEHIFGLIGLTMAQIYSN